MKFCKSSSVFFAVRFFVRLSAGSTNPNLLIPEDERYSPTHLWWWVFKNLKNTCGVTNNFFQYSWSVLRSHLHRVYNRNFTGKETVTVFENEPRILRSHLQYPVNCGSLHCAQCWSSFVLSSQHSHSRRFHSPDQRIPRESLSWQTCWWLRFQRTYRWTTREEGEHLVTSCAHLWGSRLAEQSTLHLTHELPITRTFSPQWKALQQTSEQLFLTWSRMLSDSPVTTQSNRTEFGILSDLAERSKELSKRVQEKSLNPRAKSWLDLLRYFFQSFKRLSFPAALSLLDLLTSWIIIRRQDHLFSTRMVKLSIRQLAMLLTDSRVTLLLAKARSLAYMKWLGNLLTDL